MTIRVIIPVKAPTKGKTRLAGVLDDVARAGLVRAMLERVVAAVGAADSVDQICLLGPAVHGMANGLTLLTDPGGGLNAALTAALAQSGNAARVIILPADLPQLTSSDVDRLATVPSDMIVIASDRHGTGTNALSLPVPLAMTFAFSFGQGSFLRHASEAARLGLKLDVITSNGLARDIDVPDDLSDAFDCISTGGANRRVHLPQAAKTAVARQSG